MNGNLFQKITRLLWDILDNFVSTVSAFLRFGIPEIICIANLDAPRKLGHNGAPQTMISMHYFDILSREL